VGWDAVGADAPGGGDGVQGGFDLVLDRGDSPVQECDVVQVDADQPGMVLAAEHALQGVLDAFAPALELGRGHGGQGLGVVLAVGDGFQDVAGGLGPGQPRHHR
jgi:hypothetical protein